MTARLEYWLYRIDGGPVVPVGKWPSRDSCERQAAGLAGRTMEWQRSGITMVAAGPEWISDGGGFIIAEVRL